MNTLNIYILITIFVIVIVSIYMYKNNFNSFKINDKIENTTARTQSESPIYSETHIQPKINIQPELHTQSETHIESETYTSSDSKNINLMNTKNNDKLYTISNNLNPSKININSIDPIKTKSENTRINSMKPKYPVLTKININSMKPDSTSNTIKFVNINNNNVTNINSMTPGKNINPIKKTTTKNCNTQDHLINSIKLDNYESFNNYKTQKKYYKYTVKMLSGPVKNKEFKNVPIDHIINDKVIPIRIVGGDKGKRPLKTNTILELKDKTGKWNAFVKITYSPKLNNYSDPNHIYFCPNKTYLEFNPAGCKNHKNTKKCILSKNKNYIPTSNLCINKIKDSDKQLKYANNNNYFHNNYNNIRFYLHVNRYFNALKYFLKNSRKIKDKKELLYIKNVIKNIHTSYIFICKLSCIMIEDIENNDDNNKSNKCLNYMLNLLWGKSKAFNVKTNKNNSDLENRISMINKTNKVTEGVEWLKKMGNVILNQETKKVKTNNISRNLNRYNFNVAIDKLPNIESKPYINIADEFAKLIIKAMESSRSYIEQIRGGTHNTVLRKKIVFEIDSFLKQSKIIIYKMNKVKTACSCLNNETKCIPC